MEQATSNYQLLIEKLDRFIRKFYINHVIRGCLYSAAVILGLFLLFNFLEHEFYFGTAVRKVLFFSFIGVSLAAIGAWVIHPLAKYFRLGKTIDHEQAAAIIGDHFEDVQDKLLNILQLRKQADFSGHAALIDASIQQKTESIRLIPFRSAIDLSQNRKYLKYALPPFLLLLFVLFAAPSIIKDSTHRLIHNDRVFEREAPFRFEIQESDLRAVQYSDFSLHVDVEGDVLPNEVFIDVDNYQYRLKKVGPSMFAYQFKNLQKTVDFALFSGSVRSNSHTLTVLNKPNLVDFSMHLDYPAYTGRHDERLSNIGDVVVPAGTRIGWEFETVHTDELEVLFDRTADLQRVDRTGDDHFAFKKRVLRDEPYKIYISNRDIPRADSIHYRIHVVADQFPSISVQKFQDSLENDFLYFVGRASDDYGLSKITFNYIISDQNGVAQPLVTQEIADKLAKESAYDHTIDIPAMNLNPGDEVQFYFEAFDNDGVRGSKSSKTNVMTLSKPSIEALKEMEDENEEDIKDSLEESIKESKQIQKELQALREKLLQKKELSWQEKQQLEALMERQKELQEKIQEAREKFDENLKNQEELSQKEEEILEKQEQLQELFEETMTDEMQELMEKIQELMQELEKDNALDMMEQMEFNEQSLEKNMDRLLELFKQLEVEKEMKETIDALNELAEKEEALSEQTENQEQSQDALKKEQEEINEAFEDIQEKLDELEKKNEELQFPKDLGDDNDAQMEDIQQDLENSQEQLENSENQKASESQKSAAQKMKSMAGNLQMNMEAGEMEQMQEDLKALRQLLENLVTLSFDQEDLIARLARTNQTTPRYVSLVQEQFKIKDDFQIVDDSLQALSKRVSQIETFITEKVTEIQQNLSESIEQLEERQKPTASQHQRFTMKNLNDLALMLSEAMNSMQQQMAGMMQGNQMCNKPGGNGKSGDVPMDKITEKQRELGEQMQQMQRGQQSGEGSEAKDFAKAAAKQAALRKAMQELMQKQQEQGNPAQQLQEIIDQMDENETDLVNKRLNNEMLKRQQDILTRLLDAERAEREREYDNKRKAEQASEKTRKIPPALEKYIKEREAEVDMFKTVSPSLKPYYKVLVESYYRALKQD